MSKILQLTFILCIIIFKDSFAYPGADYDWHSSLSEDQILLSLRNSKITHMIPMEEYLHENQYEDDFGGEVYLAILDNGIKASFKVVPADDLGDAIAEVAAYRASRFLNLDLVPPTVIRKVDNNYGSLQFFVKPSVDALSKDQYDKAFAHANPVNVANLHLFYFIFGQWDAGPHNIIVQYNGDIPRLIAIDNAGIRYMQYAKYGDFPFVRVIHDNNLNTKDFNTPFPFDNTLTESSAEKFREKFKHTLPHSFLDDLARCEQPIRYVIWRNSVWAQFYKGNKKFKPSYTQYYPEETIESLRKLDIDTLKYIFSYATNTDFLTDEYLKSILERRDQILNDYYTIQKNYNSKKKLSYDN